MRKHIAGLPDFKTLRAFGAPCFLYAFEFADGSVKIGRSGWPNDRAAELTRRFKKQIVRGHVAPFYGNGRVFAERAALAVARRIATQSKESTEVFYGLKFGAAATVVTQMARRPFPMAGIPPSQTPAGRKAARIRKAQALRASA